ncbi:unnamed protein product [Ilex paraguariensis]|uniref:Uncharacterized protein n=1 Tax=Ilex paraguariensis TaxID=185542 RepID=A0ABC8TIP5_9AQUA
MPSATDGGKESAEMKVSESNVHWALGKAGEDRVHVVGGLFIGIYDGFNSPYAPEFLIGNLYKDLYNELEGLLWDNENNTPQELQNLTSENTFKSISTKYWSRDWYDRGSIKVTFQFEGTEIRRRRLWEFLAEDDPEDGLDLSGSERFVFSVDDALSKKDNKKLFPWRFGLEGEEKPKVEENRVEEERNRGIEEVGTGGRAMPSALEITELPYLDMTEKVLDRYPELALMGS